MESNPDFPVLDVLVDGEELGAVPGGRKWQGWDPDEILRRPTPLLPGRKPHRVAVYRCSCGDVGCSCIAVVITREQGRIHWRDARTYTGVYVSPTDPDVERYPGRRIEEIPDFVFDARQYRAAMHWSIVDRSWETPARLLLDRLPDELPPGWTTLWCAPHPTAPGLTRALLRGPGRPGFIVSLPTGTDTGVANAATMAALLASTPAESWTDLYPDVEIRHQH